MVGPPRGVGCGFQTSAACDFHRLAARCPTTTRLPIGTPRSSQTRSKILTGHSMDLVADRTRTTVNRLRAQLSGRQRRRPDRLPPDRLAGFGGVAAVPRDSGTISGNRRRPQRSATGSNASSTPPRCSASEDARNPAGSTTANRPRASATPKPSSPLHVAATTSCGCSP
jgi:hypothetical protein